MSRVKILILTFAIALTSLSVPSDAQAGPLLDWLRGVCKRPRTTAGYAQSQGCNTCAQPQQVAAPSTARFVGTHNPAGLQPGQCMRTCNQTCSRTVVNYVPYTAYRTDWKRTPCTQYKPVTNSDPVTGCTVTCMKPCTTYKWQMQRTPYTTYRPVYRQENYTVPVTTITNDCATGTCNTGTCNTGCDTCATGVQQQPMIQSQQQPFVVPNQALPTPANSVPTIVQPPADSTSYYGQPTTYGQPAAYPQGLTTNGSYETYGNSANYGQPASYGSGTRSAIPANASPMLDSIPSSLNPQNMQRPIIDQFEKSYPTGNYWPRQDAPGYQPRQTRGVDDRRVDNNVHPVRDLDSNMNELPRMISVQDKTAKSPVRRQWAYSPIRLASYTSTVEPNQQYQPEIRTVRRAQVKVKPQAKAKPKMNSGWEPVQW